MADVAQAVVNAVTNDHSIGQTFDLTGQVKWKREMGHAWLLHVTTASVVFILQKQTELRPDDG